MADTLQDMLTGATTNNLFMQCDEPNVSAFCSLPEGFSARPCRQNELGLWKEMWAQGKYLDFVNYYYKKVYAPQKGEFFRRTMFAVNENDKPVATAGIWCSYGKINTVMFFHVLPEYQGQGIGRGLFSEILKHTTFPVYVHTHPIATRAIRLYSEFGFKFVSDSVVGYWENNLQEGLAYLKEVLSEKDFEQLQTTTANPSSLEATLLSELAEF